MSKQADFNFIRYANCWEDSKILSKALRIKPTDIGASIASGGDNTFALLLDDPKKIYAFDLNPTELYVVELKMSVIRNLEQPDALAFLGVTDSPTRIQTYQTLRTELSKDARAYFDSNLKQIERGIIHVGKFEHYFQIFRNKVAPLFTSRKKLTEFAKISDLDEQQKFYQKYINNHRLKIIFKLFFGAKTMGKLGRDKSFYDYVEKDGVAGRIKKRFEAGIGVVKNKTNPYINYVLTNNYSTDALPEYLKPKNYPIVRNRLNRIELVLGDLFAVDKKIDFFNLSDIFEYMSPEDFQKNMQHLAKISRTDARIAFWNMQSDKRLDEPFEFDEKLSKQLTNIDRAYFYKEFLVYYKGQK